MPKKLSYISIAFNLLFIVGFLYLVHLLGGWKYMYYRIQNRGLASEYEHRKSLYENMELQTGDIIFLGNSLTAQCEWAELLNNPSIKNRGIPGESTDGILRRIDAICSSNPSQLFLMIGVNDLLFHSPDYVIANYKLIVKKIRQQSPQTKLYLYSILPVNTSLRKIPISNDDIKAINQEIEQIAKDNQLIYINLYDKFSDKDGVLFAKFTTDGIHLNGEAYLLWKSEIIPFLE